MTDPRWLGKLANAKNPVMCASREGERNERRVTVMDCEIQTGPREVESITVGEMEVVGDVELIHSANIGETHIHPRDGKIYAGVEGDKLFLGDRSEIIRRISGLSIGKWEGHDPPSK